MKLTVTHANAPSDAEFAIAGLGLFTNGESRDVTEEQQEAFFAINGYKVEEIKSEYIKLGGKATLKAAENEGVPVEENLAEKGDEDEPTEDEGGDS
jgi:hypothetical protein